MVYQYHIAVRDCNSSQAIQIRHSQDFLHISKPSFFRSKKQYFFKLNSGNNDEPILRWPPGTKENNRWERCMYGNLTNLCSIERVWCKFQGGSC